MKNNPTILVITLALTALLGTTPLGAAHQESPAVTGPAPPTEARPTTTLQERLRTLTPDQPALYFNLAEDSLDQRQFELATRLFVLAAHLDSARFGRSACLGIAAIAQTQKNPERTRQMRAIARMFPSVAGSAIPNSTNNTNTATALTLDENTSPEAEYRHAGALISAFLGFYRTGFGNRALKTLDLDSQTYVLLAEYDSAVGSISTILEYCRENTRCHLCQNTLFIERPEAHQIRQDYKNNPNRNRRPLAPADEFEICPDILTYRPQLSNSQEKRLLNIETALAGGTKARWGAQLALAKNKTRPILDPAFLPRMLNIDPNQTIYRNGEWQHP